MTRRRGSDTPSFAGLVLYEDADLVVVNKPAGLASQGGDGLSGRNLIDLARAHYGGAQVAVLHRLDRNVSGVVILARTSRFARLMSSLVAAQKLERVYWAWVSGQPQAEEFVVDAWLAKDAERNQVTARLASTVATLPELDRKLFREARTEVRVLRNARTSRGSVALVEVRPITGRSHQIRVHLAFVGLPILGDPKYGRGDPQLGRPLLHALSVAFRDPRDGTARRFEAPLPFDARSPVSAPLPPPPARTQARRPRARVRFRGGAK